MILILLILGTASSVWCNRHIATCPTVCKCSVIMEKNVTVCQEGGFTEFPKAISNGTEFLDFSGNAVRKLENKAFLSRGLTNLETLVLDSTGIEIVEANAFIGLKWLKELDLSNNSIVAIDSFIFSENKLLEMVNFSGNPILKLSSFQITALPHLKTLDFRNCALKEVEREAFSNLLSLETLSLRNNQLATLPMNIFTWLKHLKTVDLRENPWRCDCDVQNIAVLLVIRKLYSPGLTCKYEGDPSNQTHIWRDMESVNVDCIPTIESNVKENLLSVSKQLHERHQFSFMDTSKKLSSQYVESSFLLIAIITVVVVVSLLCLISCYRKCRRGYYKRRNYDFEGSFNGTFEDDCSDISLSIEL